MVNETINTTAAADNVGVEGRATVGRPSRGSRRGGGGGTGKHGAQAGEEVPGVDGRGLEKSRPLGLLALTLEFATAEVARAAALSKTAEPAISVLPMTMLEDFLDSQVRITNDLGFSTAVPRTCTGSRWIKISLKYAGSRVQMNK